jgi:hypothetical protein
VSCEHFTVEKVICSKNSEYILLPGQMKILIFLDGCGNFQSANGLAFNFKAGDTFLIPACYEGKIACAADTRYLNVIVNWRI